MTKNANPQRRPKVRREVMPAPAVPPAVHVERQREQARKEITSGMSADAILASPAFNQVMSAVSDFIENSWKHSLPDEIEVRENAYKLQVLHNTYMQKFRELSRAGADAKVLMEDLERKESVENGPSG